MDKICFPISLHKGRGGSFPGGLRSTLWVLLLLQLGLMPCLGESLAQRLDKDLQAHAGYLAANAPPEVKNGSTLAKAKYVFKEYCVFLNFKRLGVNSNIANQLQGSRFGDGSMLKCGWHTDKLKMYMSRMGIRDEDMSGIVADANSSLPYILSPNQDHGALAVRDKDGKVYVFDAWQLAVNNVILSTGINAGAYAGAETSKWNGMEAKLWDTEMRAQGYVRFNDPQMLNAGYATDLQSVLKRIFVSNQASGAWEGEWFGVKQELLLKKVGTKVTGQFKETFQNYTATVEGTVDEGTPNILVGTIEIHPYVLLGKTEPGSKQKIKWTLNKDGTSFSAEYGSAGIWVMTRTRKQP